MGIAYSLDMLLPILKLRERHYEIDRDGALQDFEASGLYAVCIQHEMDHLIGKLFLNRMADMSTLTQLAEFEKYWQKEPATLI